MEAVVVDASVAVYRHDDTGCAGHNLCIEGVVPDSGRIHAEKNRIAALFRQAPPVATISQTFRTISAWTHTLAETGRPGQFIRGQVLPAI
jgi:hypothetical protein